MKVLFLGGPYDGQHHEVSDDLPRCLNVMPPQEFSVDAILAAAGPGPLPASVLYTLRETLGGGAPAYVAPGWPPPPKPCAVPGCANPARRVFTAAEPGRLAGRDWATGDQIDLCPAHGYDVDRAQGAYGVDQLAEWLRPDARADVLDWAGLGLAAEEVAASRAHALRVRP